MAGAHDGLSDAREEAEDGMRLTDNMEQEGRSMNEVDVLAILNRATVETLVGLALIIAVSVGGLIWMYRQPRTRHQRFRERF